jgi:hypothetical protein
MNALKNSTRHKPKATTVLTAKETRITPKLSMDMVSPSWKLLFEALFSHQILSHNMERSSCSLGAHQRAEMGVGNERWVWVFIGKVYHQLSVRPTD